MDNIIFTWKWYLGRESFWIFEYQTIICEIQGKGLYKMKLKSVSS